MDCLTARLAVHGAATSGTPFPQCADFQSQNAGRQSLIDELGQSVPTWWLAVYLSSGYAQSIIAHLAVSFL